GRTGGSLEENASVIPPSQAPSSAMQAAHCCAAKSWLFFELGSCITKASKDALLLPAFFVGPTTPPPPSCWSVLETRRTSSRAGFSILRIDPESSPVAPPDES